MDLERSLEIHIGKFLKAERDERRLIYAGTLTGDPVTDENQIIRQYIFANKQRLETFNKMRRIYDAARTLKISKKTMEEIFQRRPDLYKLIKKNKFKPFGISEGMEDAYEKIAKRYGIKNPLTKRIRKRIKKLENKLKKQKLNRDYKLMDEERWVLPTGKKSILDKVKDLLPGEQTQTPPLQPTPTPVVNQAQMAQKDPQTNLTRTETALLSPTEKVIAGRT